jgi:hypothetical protein
LLHFLAEYLHAAAADLIQAAEQMQQGALARTDAPTMARRSPRRTSRLTPLSAASSSAMVKVLS